MVASSQVVASTRSGRLIGLIGAGHFRSHFYMSVFGFVSTGLNIGGIIAPPLFGYLLDRGQPNLLFLAVAAISLLTVATVLATGRASRA